MPRYQPVIQSLKRIGDKLQVTWNQPTYPDHFYKPKNGYRLWIAVPSELNKNDEYRNQYVEDKDGNFVLDEDGKVQKIDYFIKINDEEFLQYRNVTSPYLIPFRENMCVEIQALWTKANEGYYRMNSKTVCYDSTAEPEPELPTLNVTVNGLEFDIRWQQKPHDKFTGFTAEYQVALQDGTIVEAYQPLEKSCPFPQGQCGALDNTVLGDGTIQGGYVHVHQHNAVFNHTFRITSHFDGFSDKSVSVSKLSEPTELTIEDRVTELEDKVEEILTRLDEL